MSGVPARSVAGSIKKGETMKQKTKDNIQMTVLFGGVVLGLIVAWAIQFPLNFLGANFITIKHILALWFWCPIVGGIAGFWLMLKI